MKISIKKLINIIKMQSLMTKIFIIFGMVIFIGGTISIIAFANHNQNTISEEESNTEKQSEETEKETAKNSNDNKKTEQPNNTKTTQITTEEKGKNNNAVISSTNEAINNDEPAKPSTNNNKPINSNTNSREGQNISATEQATNIEADYNLNDMYVIANFSIPMFVDDGTYSNIAEIKDFVGIEKFNGSSCCGLPDAVSKAEQYAKAHGYVTGAGSGCIPITWTDVVSQGKALDESKCAQHGLSCGRW